jgi:hypothetical protein
MTVPTMEGGEAAALTRPPLALDRLRGLPDGRIAYRVKYARRGAAKHRVMTAMELMARLSALVPPPRYPLVRFHGVLAPRSSWRRDVIPSAPSTRPKREPTVVRHAHRESPARDEAGAESPRRAPAPTPRSSLSGSRPVASTSDAQDASSCAVVPDVVRLAHNVISVRHWQRLRDGALLAGSPYVDWARLLQRTFEVDVLACAHCGGRLRVLAVITEPEPVHRILEHLRMTPDPTPLARARDPTDDAAESTWADEPM